MQITTLTLCDAASVREGLLNVIGGGITALGRPSFPAPLSCDIGIYISHRANQAPGDLTVTLRLSGSKEPVAEIVAKKSKFPDGFEKMTGAAGTPLALNARDLGLPRAGDYVLQVTVEGGRGLSYNFTVNEMVEEPVV